MIFPDVRQVQTNSSSEIFEQMIRITEDDDRHSRGIRCAMKALEFANSRKAKVIDHRRHSPMNVYAACTLIAASIVDSLVALSVINACRSMKRQAD